MHKKTSAPLAPWPRHHSPSKPGRGGGRGGWGVSHTRTGPGRPPPLGGGGGLVGRFGGGGGQLEGVGGGGREACTQKLWCRCRHGPDTTISQKPGGEGGGGGGVAYKDRAWSPPPPPRDTSVHGTWGPSPPAAPLRPPNQPWHSCDSAADEVQTFCGWDFRAVRTRGTFAICSFAVVLFVRCANGSSNGMRPKWGWVRDTLEGGGGGYPPPPRSQPMPSHCLPDAKCQLQWHL